MCHRAFCDLKFGQSFGGLKPRGLVAEALWSSLWQPLSDLVLDWLDHPQYSVDFTSCFGAPNHPSLTSREDQRS